MVLESNSSGCEVAFENTESSYTFKAASLVICYMNALLTETDQQSSTQMQLTIILCGFILSA